MNLRILKAYTIIVPDAEFDDLRESDEEPEDEYFVFFDDFFDGL